MTWKLIDAFLLSGEDLFIRRDLMQDKGYQQRLADLLWKIQNPIIERIPIFNPVYCWPRTGKLQNLIIFQRMKSVTYESNKIFFHLINH